MKLPSLLRFTLLSIALTAGAVSGAHAQRGEAESGTPGSELTVYLVTMGPGEAVWERFSHNALWIHDPVGGTDRIYNYGMFSFRQENFLVRFVQGRMLYWTQAFETESHLRAYVAVNRSIWVQELNLTPEQRVELRDFLAWNVLPDNRFYPYDYYLDNCSTRIRDAIDMVLGGRLREVLEARETGTTFRFHTRRLLAPDLGAYTGTLFSLGHPIDRPVSEWETAFLPVQLQHSIRDVTVLDADGNEAPLVLSEQTLHTSTMPPELDEPPNWLLQFFLAGALLAAMLYALTVNAADRRWARVCGTALATAWSLLVGLGGVFMVAVWLFTDHWAAYQNENLFFLNPLALPLVVLLPLAALGKPWAERWARWLALVVAATALVGFAIQVLPQFYQVNGEIIAVTLPPTLLMAWAAAQRSIRSSGPN